MEGAKLLAPNELKTIEIDVEKKIFRVNGEDFGSDCDEFRINCSTRKNSSRYLEVSMFVKAGIVFANYDFNGRKTKEECRRKRRFWR